MEQGYERCESELIEQGYAREDAKLKCAEQKSSEEEQSEFSEEEYEGEVQTGESIEKQSDSYASCLKGIRHHR